MAKKYSRSPIFFRYLGGLDGDADVTDAEKASITAFIERIIRGGEEIS